jgi:RNA binding exosome subunit
MGSPDSLSRIVSIEFSTIAHATEDLTKVETAMLNILPQELRGSILILRQYLKGHYRNPIATLAMRIRSEKAARMTLEHVFKMMSQTERGQLDREFESYIDEEMNFYIRLDKQEAFKGRIRLTQGDPIRVRIKTKTWQQDSQDEKIIFRKLGMRE